MNHEPPPDHWRRIESIFQDAIELGAAERERFLEYTCAGNARLQAEMRRLLRAHETAGRFLEGLDPVGVAELLASDDSGMAAATPELVPSEASVTIGRYRVVRKLGSGGMGLVYLAHDPRLNRDVAVKLLSPRLAGEEAKRRFMEEAKAASALDHPNIATIFEVDETEEGRPFIAMAAYDGETLSDRLRRGPLPVSDVVDLARQIAEGLRVAHANGILHRDIKPGNIIITPAGTAKIVDFGVAKVMGSTLTEPGVAVGTVAYMSPEQTTGSPVDARSDVWSLGVVMCEMLNGRNPFALSDDRATIHAVRYDDPAPIEQACSAVPVSLARVIDRCLRKEPDERYADGGALADAVAVAAAAPGPAVRTRERLAAAALLILVVAGMLGVILLPGNGAWPRILEAVGTGRLPLGLAAVSTPPTSPVRIAVLPFAVLGGERFAYLEDGMVELLTTQLDGAGPFRGVDPRALLAFVRARGRAEQGRGWAADGPALARRFNADLFVTGSVVEVGGRLRIRAALYSAKGELQTDATTQASGEGELFDLVDRLARELISSRYAGPTGRLTRLAAATTPSVPALKAYLEGERALREGRFDRALDSFGDAVERDSTFALAWYRLAVAAEWTIRPTIAAEAADRAVRLASPLPENDRLLVRAWHAYANGAAAEAERSYRQILDDYPEDVEALLQLGEVLFHYGPLNGRPLAEAGAPFKLVLGLEPVHEGALLHLARIAAREGAFAELDDLVDRLLAAQPESEIAIEVRTLRAFARGDEAARRAVLAELKSLGSDAVLTALWTASYTRDPTAIAHLARLLTDGGRPSSVRATGHLLLATAELARGRPQRAREELATAERLNRAWAVEIGALYAASDVPPGAALAVHDILGTVEAWDAAATAAGPASNAFITAHEGAHHRLKAYLRGLLSAARGDLSAASAAARELEAPEGVASTDTLAAYLARALNAEALSRAGRHATALALLESRLAHSSYSLAVASPFHAASRERFLRAQLLSQLGRPNEALDFYLSMGDGSVYDLPYLAPAHLAAAAILEELRDTESAADHYRHVAELWRDAEPELLPTVEWAKRKASALERSPP